MVYFVLKYILLFANGTIALILTLQVSNIKGEVINTSFFIRCNKTFAIVINIKPVFVDVEPKYFTIDPNKIELAITSCTTAILSFHVYGNPCKIEKIKSIANTYGLKVIYDAAHTFGVKLNEISILNFGNLSVLSFHATKVFTTLEGGAIVCHDKEMKRRIDYMKNFGFANGLTIVGPGINKC